VDKKTTFEAQVKYAPQEDWRVVGRSPSRGVPHHWQRARFLNRTDLPAARAKPGGGSGIGPGVPFAAARGP
jgi:hypothetical protein